LGGEKISAKTRTYLFMALAFLVWGILASLVAGYYYNLYNNLSSATQKATINVNIGLKNGNANITWFNGTSAKAGDSLLAVTKLIATVNYTEYTLPPGAFVTSINNVSNHGSLNWMWWTYSTSSWSLGQVACDKYIVSNGETCVWYFEDTSSYPQLSTP
jgi:hypothetical protein